MKSKTPDFDSMRCVDFKDHSYLYDSDYEGSIYLKKDGKITKIGHAGLSVAGHKAYDDFYKRGLVVDGKQYDKTTNTWKFV